MTLDIRDKDVKNFFMVAFSDTVRATSNTRYGEFKLFLGTPIKATYGSEWENITTVLYYAPLNTLKSEKNVKLIVKPKKARVRGDPTFYQGEDYDLNKSLRLEQLHIVTDAVFYDEETNELTYNFDISLVGSSWNIDLDIKKIEAKGKNIRKADRP